MEALKEADLDAMMRLSAQIVRKGRKTIYRLLGWNRWLPAFACLGTNFERPWRRPHHWIHARTVGHAAPPSPHHPRVLLSGLNDPSVIPPIQLSPNQVTTLPERAFRPLGGPNAVTELPPWIWTPTGAYDLPRVLGKSRTDLPFDLVVVQADAGLSNLPTNLGQFDCRRVLLVCDTHHMRTPIRSMIDYAQSEGFEYIVSAYDRHHLHWFREMGFCKLAWISGLAI